MGIFYLQMNRENISDVLTEKVYHFKRADPLRLHAFIVTISNNMKLQFLQF